MPRRKQRSTIKTPDVPLTPEERRRLAHAPFPVVTCSWSGLGWSGYSGMYGAPSQSLGAGRGRRLLVRPSLSTYDNGRE